MPIRVEYKLGRGQHWYNLPELYQTFEQAFQAAHTVIYKECIDMEAAEIELYFRKVK
jgi:hypothetical protein